MQVDFCISKDIISLLIYYIIEQLNFSDKDKINLFLLFSLVINLF